MKFKSATLPHVISFESQLGWFALAADDTAVFQLVFGYPNAIAAVNALNASTGAIGAQSAADDTWQWLADRLADYAAGIAVDFRDVPLHLDHLTAFQRRVVKHCRQIAYGQTRSYKQLAEASGSAGAARAVGNTMATNRFPIVVPCHRVINADGTTGQYSAPDGPRTKCRLLELEHRASSRRQLAASKRRGRRAPVVVG